MGIRHTYQSPTLNDGAKEVSTTRWNEDHSISGEVTFPLVASPATPAADSLNVFATKTGGRMMMGIEDPSGGMTPIQPFVGRKKIAWVVPIGNGTVTTQLGIAVSITGTATAASTSSTNVHTATNRVEYAVTTTSTTGTAGWRSTAAQYFLGSSSVPYGGFHYETVFGRSRGAAANSTLRGFTGLSSNVAAPSDVNPSTATADAIGVGIDAADTNYQIMHSTASGSITKVDTGIAKSASDTAQMYRLSLYKPSSSDAGVSWEFVRLSDNVSATGIITTSLPAATTLLAPRSWYSVGGTSSVIGYALGSFYIEKDL